MPSPDPIPPPSPASQAQVHLRWLVEALASTEARFRAKETDVLGLIAVPPASQFPARTLCKLETRLSAYHEILEALRWYRGARRPWMRTLKGEVDADGP
jgi:hypothetical protein